ncbi:MAG: nucleotidyltransferase substrate binding protein [Ignavibacteriae bacterium]|nr:nucleotidyltransferase substrate binding protein [Ignavibacteriota bacterium]
MAFSEKYLKRLGSFEKALKKFQSFMTLNLDLEVLIEVASKRFEYTFETMWKVLKLYLSEAKGIECNSPLDCLRSAYQFGIIPEKYEQDFIEMVKLRNEIVHIYNEEIAIKIYNQIVPEFINAMTEVYENLKKEM